MATTALPGARRARKIRPIEIRGEVAIVTLTRGLFATIDAADVDLVKDWNWYASVGVHGHAYAHRSAYREDGTSFGMGMHRQLLAAPSGSEVDHVDGDGLNNRRANLRACSHAQNVANRVLDRRNKLGLKGVWIRGGTFRACVQYNGRTIHLGSYQTKEEAAAAYAGAARALFGEFARV